MSGTTVNMKNTKDFQEVGDRSEEKNRRISLERCTFEREDMPEMRSIFLDGCLFEQEDTSEKKRSLSLERCTSEREDMSEKKKRSMSLQRCTSEREDTSEKNIRSMTFEREDMPEMKKRKIYLEGCTSEKEDTSEKKNRSLSLQLCTSENRAKCVDFSYDLIAEILIRLPTKALCRCKCVCKSWSSLISQHSFFNEFITRSRLLPPLLTGVFYRKESSEIPSETYFLDFGTLSTTTSIVDTLPVDIYFTFLKRSILAAATHNGLVLCAERPDQVTFMNMCPYRYNYIVCDPLRKQFVDLPKPRRIHLLRNTFLFCYNKTGSGDQQTEFKVVSIVLKSTRPPEFKVELYSSEIGKWKLFSIFFDEGTVSDVVFMFDGCVYIWGMKYLLVYNFMEGTTRKVELPPDATKGGCFGASGGSLYYSQTHCSSFWVWVLIDGVGWDLVHKIDCASLASAFPDIFGVHEYGFWFHPFTFHPVNHDVVLVRTGQKMILYHTSSRTVKLIDSIDSDCPTKYPPVIQYSLPAWLPSLPSTLRQAKPAANARKRTTRSSKAAVA